MPPGLGPIRRAAPADAPAIRDLTRSAYAKWIPVIGREPKPMGADYDAAVRNHMIDLIHEGSALAGLIETIAEPAALLIENLAVAPAFQGRGIGRRLMAHAETLAHSMGYEIVRLYTNNAFAVNLSFYARLGYGVDRKEPISDGIVVYLSKRLAPQARGPLA